jgi:protein-disulfide isomerase
MTTILISLLLACFDQQSSSTPVANAAAPTTTSTNDSDNSVVATWDGGSITYAEGTKLATGQLVQMKAEYLTNKYKTETNSIEQTIMEKLFEAEMKKQGLSSQEELLKKEVEDKAESPDPAEIAVMYKQFKDRLQGMNLEQATPLISQQLVQQKQGERFQVYIQELKKQYNVSVSLPYPEVPRVQVSADDDPFLGTDGAPIEIIQFAEFQCPYCGKAGEAIDQVMEEYKGKVKMVYRDFPLGFHDRAIPAAVAANCSGEQGKYWEMHKLLMNNQRALTENDLTGHATTLGLDMTKWNTCRKDPSQEAEVRKDMADGSEVGVTGTPAFFINGIMLSGALPFSEFKTIIDQELKIKG